MSSVARICHLFGRKGTKARAHVTAGFGSSENRPRAKSDPSKEQPEPRGTQSTGILSIFALKRAKIDRHIDSM